MPESVLARAQAPSNIALIKYMGKSDVELNVAHNASLSYTLPNLLTTLEVALIDKGEDQWEPLKDEGLYPIVLGERGQRRYMQHFAFLKREFGIQGNFILRSANNFPSDCGIASSASSFAALTRAAVQVKRAQVGRGERIDNITDQDLAALSQKGSGSSCRSFFSPWVLWRSDRVEPLRLGFGELLHQVIVVEAGVKSVSSSEAHMRVLSSDLFLGRKERAERRLSALLNEMNMLNWRRCFELIWAEFWDMHALFATSQPPFQYMVPDSLRVLAMVTEYWREKNDGPWVTMDAGANVHLLYREDQRAMAESLAEKFTTVGRVLWGAR